MKPCRGAPTKEKAKAQAISNFRFEIGETAKATANADPSPKRRVREDGVGSFVERAVEVEGVSAWILGLLRE